MENSMELYGFETALELPDVRFREVREKPFDIYGLYEPQNEGVFLRMPDSVAEATSPSVRNLNKNTAGGRVRFCTDSRYVAIHAEMPYMYRADHFPRTGSSGFDLYVLEGAHYYYYGTYCPTIDADSKMLEGVINFPDRRLRQIMIHFPLYSQVEKLYIGLQQDAMLDHGRRYRYEKPVVYYGSSITQGGCASRPGTSYQAIIGVDHDCNYINLGFSGSAKGEPAIRDYIASLDMSVFVMDYDHNAPTVEHLKETHEPLYRAVRAAHPTLPIVMISKPETQWYIYPDTVQAKSFPQRRAVVLETYMKALSEGDLNVRFIDGDSLFEGAHHDACTVDGCHPNDAGFFRMADKIGHVVGALLK